VASDLIERLQQPNGRVRLGAPDLREVGDKIVASSRWLNERGEPQHSIYQVFTIREGRIIDWQDCRTRRAAERLARRHD
jgi:hypothetical protein